MFKKIVLFTTLVLMFSATIVQAAPTSFNRIGLRFAKVELVKKQLTVVPSNPSTNRYEYLDEPLTDEDIIKYGWRIETALSLENIANPTAANAYIKIFSEDDSKPENFIKDYGSSPLPVSEVKSKLKQGKNTLLFVLMDGKKGEEVTKVEFVFNYSSSIPQPRIDIISPSPSAVLQGGISRSIIAKVSNFTFAADGEKIISRGKVNLYINEVKPETILYTWNTAKTENGVSEITITSDVLEKLSTVPDSLKSKLLFTLNDVTGAQIGEPYVQEVITNYAGSLDTGLPKLKITEPVNGSKITADYTIKLAITNFKQLEKLDILEKAPNTGYVQVRADGQLISTNLTKTNFTLRELGYGDKEGIVKLRVDLTDTQFVKLEPKVFDEITLTVTKPITQTTVNTIPTNNSNWRIILIAATIALIIGSIILLVAKS
jgi:hypothetical protein